MQDVHGPLHLDLVINSGDSVIADALVVFAELTKD